MMLLRWKRLFQSWTGSADCTAPADADLELSVYDNSEYHALVFPCRRDSSDWRDARATGHVAYGDPLAAMGARARLTDQPWEFIAMRYRVSFFRNLLLCLDGSASEVLIICSSFAFVPRHALTDDGLSSPFVHCVAAPLVPLCVGPWTR